MDETVSHWVARCKNGSPEAAQKIWERYFRKLVALARLKLRGAARRVQDEEDVALSAFDSFFRAAQRGRFAKLNDRDDLWQLLVLLTVRKATAARRRQSRLKRGVNRVLDEAALESLGHEPADNALAHVVGDEPNPAFAAEVADELRRLMDRLTDDELRLVAQRKLEGFENAEIARELGCVTRTVDRRLSLIRMLWNDEERS